MDEDELAKRRAARRGHPSSLPAILPTHPRYDESPTELRAPFEAMQNLVNDVADTLDDLKMHDLAEVLRRAAQQTINDDMDSSFRVMNTGTRSPRAAAW